MALKKRASSWCFYIDQGDGCLPDGCGKHAAAVYIDLGVIIGIMKESGKENYTYLLTCRDGSFYCGWTNHLEERVKAHNEGRGAKYTKSRRPVYLSYYEVFATKEEAMRREWAIKKLSRREKERLIQGFSAASSLQEESPVRLQSDTSSCNGRSSLP